MKVAVIDLGTNTFNLLIAEVIGQGKFNKIHSDRIAVKLGEGTINQGFISPEPFKRGINALITYKQKIDELGVTTIKAFATSAIRSASNGGDFIIEAAKQAGVKVETIDGDREAELIFLGVCAGADLSNEPTVIMDIGGGSTEFIITKNKQIVWKKSYPLGASRLLQLFKPEDPIKATTIEKFNNYLSDQLGDLHEKVAEYLPKTLIGTSGAFDSFVDMIAAVKDLPSINDKNQIYPIDLSDFKIMYHQTMRSTYEDRLQIKGLIPIRVDMIVISFLLANFILHSCFIEDFNCCTYSLKEGILVEFMNDIQHQA